MDKRRIQNLAKRKLKKAAKAPNYSHASPEYISPGECNQPRPLSQGEKLIRKAKKRSLKRENPHTVGVSRGKKPE